MICYNDSKNIDDIPANKGLTDRCIVNKARQKLKMLIKTKTDYKSNVSSQTNEIWKMYEIWKIKKRRITLQSPWDSDSSNESAF
jgi:hypothetical protein